MENPSCIFVHPNDPTPHAQPANPIRVALYAKLGAEPSSVLVVVGTTEDGTTLTLQHEYEGLNPKPGFLVRGRGLNLTVASVDGRVLTCK